MAEHRGEPKKQISEFHSGHGTCPSRDSAQLSHASRYMLVVLGEVPRSSRVPHDMDDIFACDPPVRVSSSPGTQRCRQVNATLDTKKYVIRGPKSRYGVAKTHGEPKTSVPLHFTLSLGGQNFTLRQNEIKGGLANPGWLRPTWTTSAGNADPAEVERARTTLTDIVIQDGHGPRSLGRHQ